MQVYLGGVECMLSTREALGLIPKSTEKKRKGRREEIREGRKEDVMLVEFFYSCMALTEEG
jgi:hypothetical protein